MNPKQQIVETMAAGKRKRAQLLTAINKPRVLFMGCGHFCEIFIPCTAQRLIQAIVWHATQ